MILELSDPTLGERLEHYLSQDENLRNVYTTVKKDFLEAERAAHNWEHVYRGVLNAIAIGETEKANMSIVLPAILMHDIGFLFGGGGKTHAVVGAEKVGDYLEKIKTSYSPEIVQHIAKCIHAHKGSMHNEIPETLEAKVVADADLLEKFGPIGIYQYIRTWTEFKKGIEDVIKQKNLIIDLRLETETGKKLADRGRKFVVNFFEELEKAYSPYR